MSKCRQNQLRGFLWNLCAHCSIWKRKAFDFSATRQPLSKLCADITSKLKFLGNYSLALDSFMASASTLWESDDMGKHLSFQIREYKVCINLHRNFCLKLFRLEKSIFLKLLRVDWQRATHAEVISDYFCIYFVPRHISSCAGWRRRKKTSISVKFLQS